MNTQVNRTPLATRAWLHLQRAREAVNMAAAELPRTQLGPQARQQYALELAELMGEVELLLSTLRRQAGDDPGARCRTKRLASGSASAAGAGKKSGTARWSAGRPDDDEGVTHPQVRPGAMASSKSPEQLNTLRQSSQKWSSGRQAEYRYMTPFNADVSMPITLTGCCRISRGFKSRWNAAFCSSVAGTSPVPAALQAP